MALPAHILDRLPQELRKNGLLRSAESLEGGSLSGRDGWGGAPGKKNRSDVLTGTWSEDDELGKLLGEGGAGGVVELTVPGASLGTSLALFACAEAQRRAVAAGRALPMCAFIDAGKTLYAPGVERAGVSLDHLLVVRPEEEAIGRVALRLLESRLFAVVIVDLVGAVPFPLDVSLGSWVRLVRRMNLALEGSANQAFLLTDQLSPRPLTLPVAQRVELFRAGPRELSYRIARDRRGIPGGRRSLAWPLLGLARAQSEGSASRREAS